MERVHERSRAYTIYVHLHVRFHEYSCCCLLSRVPVNLATSQVHLCLKMLMSDAEAGDEGDGRVMAASSVGDPTLAAEEHRGADNKPTDVGQRVARIESALQDSNVRHEGRLASMETSLQVGLAFHLLLRASTSACWCVAERCQGCSVLAV